MTLDDDVTKDSAHGVKSSGIWKAVWGTLTSLPTGFTSLYDWCVSQLAEKVPWANDAHNAVTIGSRESGSTIGSNSLAQGLGVEAAGGNSHAEGELTRSEGSGTHTEGTYTYADGFYTHAEGYGTQAVGAGTHAEGAYTHTDGFYTHAEGGFTTAGKSDGNRGRYAHAAGFNAQATNTTAFTWNGSANDNPSTSSTSPDYVPPYGDHGNGTYNLNPVGGLSGFWIGEQNFANLFNAKVGSFAAVGGVTPTVSEGVANVSALFTTANTLLKQTIIDVAGEKVNIGVTAVTQDGVTVTGQTVYVHNGTSADDPVVASIAYDGQPVTLTVDKGIQYFVRISDTLAMHFNPTTASGHATADVQVTLTYVDVSTVTDLNDIAPALAVINNLARARTLLVGKEFPDVWIDYDGSGDGDATPAQVGNMPVWNDPLILTDVQMVEDADGNTHLGAVLTRKYATRYDIVFDAPNTEEATEATAQAGLYYYGLAKGADAPAAGNVTYLDLAAGDAIPYANYEKVYRNTLRESFDANTKIVADYNVIRNGHNRYETSAYRQYLNSDGPRDGWWTRQRIGQMKPSSASNYCGYKRGCSAKLLSLIKPVKRRCVPNYVTDGGSSSDQSVGLYTVCDEFFLPSCGEMFGESNNNEVYFNGEYNYQYTYWRWLANKPNLLPSNSGTDINLVRPVRRVNSKTGSAVAVRLRSAVRDYSYHTWHLATNGPLSTYGSGVPLASVPACVIY